MRSFSSTISKLALLVAAIVVSSAAGAHAQINPNQINWPTGGAGCVYAPGTNTCVPPGVSPPNGVVDTTGGTYNTSCGLTLDERATGATTVNLPAVSTGCSGVIMRGPSAGAVTIAPPGGVSYDGVTTQLPQGEAIGWYTDGTGYHSTRPTLAGAHCSITAALTGNTLDCTGGSGGGSPIPSNAIFVFALTSINDDDHNQLSPLVGVSGWSQSGSVVSFTTSAAHGFAIGDWVNMRFLTGWPAPPSYMILGTGYTLFQVTAVGSSTTFQVNVGSVSAGTCASSCGSVATAMNNLPFATTAHSVFPSGALNRTYMFLSSSVTVGGTYSNYTSLFHALSPGQNGGRPGYLILNDHGNDDSLCNSPSSVQTAYSNLFAAAHADGWTVVVGTGVVASFNQFTGCNSAWNYWLSNRNWLHQQKKTTLNTSSGQYVDILVDTGNVVADGSNGYYLGGSGGLGPTAAAEMSDEVSNAIFAGAGTFDNRPGFWGGFHSTPSAANGWVYVPSADGVFAFQWWNAAGSAFLGGIDSSNNYWHVAGGLSVGYGGAAQTCPAGTLFCSNSGASVTDVYATNQGGTGTACAGLDSSGKLTRQAAGCLTGNPGPPLCSDTSGSATAQSCTLSPATTVTSPMCFMYQTTTPSGASLTLAINGGSALPVDKWLGTAVTTGDMPSGHTVLACINAAGNTVDLMTIGNAPSGGSAAVPDWSSSNSYSKGSAVMYNGNLYVANTSIVAAGSPVVVQSASGSTTAVFGSAVTGGNIIVLSTANVGVGTTTPPAPTDTLSLTWTTLVSGFCYFVGSNQSCQALYVASVGSGGSETITCGASHCMAMELQNVNTTVNTQANGFYNNVSLTTTTSTFIVSAFADRFATGLASYSGNTIAVNRSSAGLAYISESSPGTYSTGFTVTSGGDPTLSSVAFTTAALTPDGDARWTLISRSGCMQPKVATLTSTATSISISSIPNTCHTLVIDWYGETTTGSDNLQVTFNGDATANYDWSIMHANYSGTGTSATPASTRSNSAQNFAYAGNIATNAWASGTFTIPMYTATTPRSFAATAAIIGWGTGANGTSTYMSNWDLSGYWRNASAAITQVTITTSGGDPMSIGTTVIITGR